MKRRRAEEDAAASGTEGQAAGLPGSGADFDTGARHFRDTKQVKNDLKAIQERTLATLMSAAAEHDGDGQENAQDDPMLAALLALGLDREDAQERCWKVKPGQCVVCLVGGGDEESVLECSYCQRDVCLSCLQRCELCQQLFCSTCAVTNHDLRQDRLLCLSCNAEDLKQRHNHQAQHSMDEVPPQ